MTNVVKPNLYIERTIKLLKRKEKVWAYLIGDHRLCIDISLLVS